MSFVPFVVIAIAIIWLLYKALQPASSDTAAASPAGSKQNTLADSSAGNETRDNKHLKSNDNDPSRNSDHARGGEDDGGSDSGGGD